jgi:serine/threonine protein kinase
MAEAHEKGIVHRDLKPSNISMNQRGEPVVMDFGLARRNKSGDARLTKSGAVIGTPAYMPPEQIEGDVDAIGPCCDIYSLGVILYELLTGEIPFDGPIAAVLGQVLTQEPPLPSSFRPDLDPRLEAVCLKMMAKEIKDRYASMIEVADALSDFSSETVSGGSSLSHSGQSESAPPLRTTPSPLPQSAGENSLSPSDEEAFRAPITARSTVGRRRKRQQKRRRKTNPAWFAIVGAGVLLVVVAIVAYIGFGGGHESNQQESDRNVASTGDRSQDEVAKPSENSTPSKTAPTSQPPLRESKEEPDAVASRITATEPPDGSEATATAKAQLSQDDFTPLFDGKTPEMQTNRMYENFIIELEYRHLKEKGNGGLFVWSDGVNARPTSSARSIEVQILDGINTDKFTSHGDIFPVGGATMKPDRPHRTGSMRSLPSERRAKPAGQWNHYRVTCNDGVIKLAVNGKVVSGGSACTPRKGYIWLESENSSVEFRNVRIKELPSTNPKPETTIDDDDFKSLFDGKTLKGWEGNEYWKVIGGAIVGECPPKTGGFLVSQKRYKNFVFKLKFKLHHGNSGIFFRDYRLSNGGIANFQAEIGYIPRLPLNRGKDFITGAVNAEVQARHPDSFAADMPEALKPKILASTRNADWSDFVITAQGDRIAIEVNGYTTVDFRNTKVEKDGLIRLQLHGGGTKVAFKNIFIKELPD